MAPPITFPRFLALRREALRKTQAEIAQPCSITAEAISQFEGGHRKPRLAILSRLADALRVDRTTLCRFALRSRAPELYASLGLPPVRQECLDSAGQRAPASNHVLEDEEAEDREGSDGTQRDEVPARLDTGGAPEARERPC